MQHLSSTKVYSLPRELFRIPCLVFLHITKMVLKLKHFVSKLRLLFMHAAGHLFMEIEKIEELLFKRKNLVNIVFQY